jgi:formate transporter FocA
MTASQSTGFDALVPAEMAGRAAQVGVRKAGLDPLSLIMLAVLAGAFISLGALFSTTVSAGSQLSFGLTRLIAGLVFSLGLVLVIVGGAELFTGNTLIIMAWAGRQVSTGQLLLNWLIVYLGNLIGALGTVLLVFWSGQYTFGGGSVGATALATAQAKAELDFLPALMLGILCNVLVCLAVWLTFSARSTVDRIACIVGPVTAFVAAGFEHSIANMYFIPLGLAIKAAAPPSFWSAIGRTPADYPLLTWENFLIGNLLPVTLGNLIGGTLLVGAVYWLIYLRPRSG